MIRIARTLGHCSVCTSGSVAWAPHITTTPVLVLRITASSRSGAGGTTDACEHHARQLVISPDYDDGRCTSCGNTGAVQQVGGIATTVYRTGVSVTRTKYAISACRKRCAPALVDRIGAALALGDGEAVEWDDAYEPPAWQSGSEQIRDAQDAARGKVRR